MKSICCVDSDIPKRFLEPRNSLRRSTPSLYQRLGVYFELANAFESLRYIGTRNQLFGRPWYSGSCIRDLNCKVKEPEHELADSTVMKDRVVHDHVCGVEIEIETDRQVPCLSLEVVSFKRGESFRYGKCADRTLLLSSKLSVIGFQSSKIRCISCQYSRGLFSSRLLVRDP